MSTKQGAITVILQGDALTQLKTLNTDSIDLIITSPPYYGLRNYGVKGQIGLEKTPQEYISNLINVFNECKRVLKKTGSCWVNIGDSYGGTGDKNGYRDPKYKNGRTAQDTSLSKNLTHKSLIGIPERFVLAMQDSGGWIRRNTIIWHKPNSMPSSAKDRFTVDFEYFYFFTQSQKYYFETQYEKTFNNEQRIKRCVWSINPKPFKEAHFATFPEKLTETPIKACCPFDGTVLDPFSGSGTTLLAAKMLNRKYIGIELNGDYVAIATKRLNDTFINNKLL